MQTRSVILAGLLLAGCAGGPDVASRHAEQVVPSPVQSAAPTFPVGPTVPAPEPVTSPPRGGVGADGVGDMLFPQLGNPGIDVQHYDVDLAYDQATLEVDGTVMIDLVLTEGRNEFTLDSLGADVKAVTVDGERVQFALDEPELRIELPATVAAGSRLEVEVAFRDEVAPEPSESGGALGWFPTEGGSFVLVEPDGLRAVIPCNDHPSDKASWAFRLTVADPLVAVANGELVARSSHAGATTFVWEERRPMATYLVQLLVGDYEIIDDVGPGGLPLSTVVLSDDRDRIDAALEMTNDQLVFFTDVLGPYPLDRYGIAVTDSFGGLAMETQGRSLFSRDDVLGPDPPGELLAHELAHQWFGNAVTLERWSDIWLNESFATYASWLWTEHVGDGSVRARAESTLVSRGRGSTAAPSAYTLFGYNSYDGGAVVLHALRLKVGDDVFFTLLRRWVTDYAGTSQGTEEFITLAEVVSDQDLDEFFDEWLYADVLPAAFPAAQR